MHVFGQLLDNYLEAMSVPPLGSPRPFPRTLALRGGEGLLLRDRLLALERSRLQLLLSARTPFRLVCRSEGVRLRERGDGERRGESDAVRALRGEGDPSASLERDRDAIV